MAMTTKNIIVVGGTGLGKSALCNVLTGTDRFKEAGYATSETQENKQEYISKTEFCVVDTVGIGNTGQPMKDVLKKLRSAFKNIWHVLIVTDGRFSKEEMEIYDILKNKFKESYVTIVRTKFSNFRKEDECDKDINAMLSLDKKIAKIINKCKVIHVDNPPIDIQYNGDDDDDDDIKAQNNYNTKTREKSRKILLNYLTEFK